MMTAQDVLRGKKWYKDHKKHVDYLVSIDQQPFPMSGSDISHPELWKPGGWRWFIAKFGVD